jgi:sarcosine oxidase subunit gamma
MSEHAKSRHGLEPFLATIQSSGRSESGARIAIRDDLGHINIRGDLTNKAFVDAVEGVLGQGLPRESNTICTNESRVFWLGPDEWLIVSDLQRSQEIVRRLQQATAQLHASINDVSGGQIVLELQGRWARDLLAKGCTLDLDEAVFTSGACAQSGLAKTNVLLGLVDDEPTFIVVVRRSFSDYLCRWLAQAGSSFGVELSGRY